MGSSWTWSTSVTESSGRQRHQIPPNTPALDFMILAAFSGVPHVSALETFERMSPTKRRDIGLGAVSAVRVGRYKGQLVAVKQCKFAAEPFSSIPDTFDHYLRQMTLEFRILTHDSLRDHPNILSLLAYGLEGLAGPEAFLVIEYAKLGSLDDFLKSGASITPFIKLNLCTDVARGLQVLHSSFICHGDVKAGNALIFDRGGADEWVVKLSDFGQAVLGDIGNLDGAVSPSLGTPLLNAPEIRTGEVFKNESFNIKSALATDIYSFGLLVWQVLKDGHHYFDPTWSSNDQGVEARITLLNFFPKDLLLKLGLSYLAKGTGITISDELFKTIFKACLRDDPNDRRDIDWIVHEMDKGLTDSHQDVDSEQKSDQTALQISEANMFDYSEPSESGSPTDTEEISVEEDQADVETVGLDSALAMPLPKKILLFDHSIFELELMLLRSLILMSRMPMIIQRMIIRELTILSQDADPSMLARKAAAAMMLSDCYIWGFGVEPNLEQMLSWLSQSAVAGLRRAQIWYPRLRSSIWGGEDGYAGDYVHCPESTLADAPNSTYMARCIRLNATTSRKSALRNMLGLTGELNMLQNVTLEQAFAGMNLDQTDIHVDLDIFDDGHVDHLSPLHWCTWFGLSRWVSDLLEEGQSVNQATRLDRTALYYACLAGNLEIVELLAKRGADASLVDTFGISPVHFSIMFEEEDAEHAINLLLRQGCTVNVKALNRVRWRDYDLLLRPQPLEWAIQTRNAHLARVLLDSGSEICGLNVAVQYYFPEIVELLLSRNATSKRFPSPIYATGPLCNPFRHWLFHGKDRLNCITRTIDVLERYGYRVAEAPRYDGFSPLFILVGNARIEEDWHLIRQLIERGADTHETCGENRTALSQAIEREPWSHGYQNLIETLARKQSKEDLNAIRDGGHAYLHRAVQFDRVDAARILLECGADVNLSTQFRFESPLQIHVEQKGSEDMFRLLTEFGADLLKRDYFFNQDFLGQSIHDRPSADVNQLNRLLDLDLPKESIMEVLWETLEQAILAGPSSSKHDIQAFGFVLCHPRVAPYVNEKNEDGMSLVHRAALGLNPAALAMLIDAGARCDRIWEKGNQSLTPLHVALSEGRKLWWAYKIQPDEEHEDFRHARLTAMETATMLLHEYHTLKSEYFRGITELHLAAYFCIAEDYIQLVESGHDPKARGTWPTNGDLITAKELLYGSLTDTYPYFICAPYSDEDYQTKMDQFRARFAWMKRPESLSQPSNVSPSLSATRDDESLSSNILIDILGGFINPELLSAQAAVEKDCATKMPHPHVPYR